MRMKKLNVFKNTAMAALATFLFAMPVQAQNEVTEFGLFDHRSGGVVLGTTGLGIDLAAPINNFLQVRAGYNFFSGFKYKEDVDYRAKGKKERGKTTAEGKNYMGTAHLLIEAYPFKNSSFHATAGFYYGTDEIVELENTSPVKDFDEGEGIVIGDHIVCFDQNGYGHGTIKVNKFRPYLGIGIGRAVPRKRIGVSGDLGVQFWGKPKVYEKQTGTYQEAVRDDFGSESDKYYDVISKFSVWPVLTIRVTGRIF